MRNLPTYTEKIAFLSRMPDGLEPMIELISTQLFLEGHSEEQISQLWKSAKEPEGGGN